MTVSTSRGALPKAKANASGDIPPDPTDPTDPTDPIDPIEHANQILKESMDATSTLIRMALNIPDEEPGPTMIFAALAGTQCFLTFTGTIDAVAGMNAFINKQVEIQALKRRLADLEAS